MTEKSSFFNDVNGDRLYKAEDWANYFNKFITNGVFPNIGSNLQVFADGTNMNVRLSAGAAWIKGYMYENTDNLILPVTVADGVLNRIDRVVIQLSYAERKISAKVKQGAFASSPVAPSLQRDADIYELGIADIVVSKGITSVKQSAVTDLRLNTALCGIVGSLAQPDTTAIFNQYQDWFNLTSTLHEEEAQIWLTAFKNKLTLDEQEFDTWFENIKGKLEGDTAAKLASDLASLTQSFTVHQAEDATLITKGHVQLSNDINSTSETLAATSKAVKDSVTAAETRANSYTDTAPENLQRNLEQFRKYKSGKDSNGIFTIIEYKRLDGSLFVKSTLTGGTSPLYTKRTVSYYAANGTTILSTINWTLSYDAAGDLISEVRS